MTVNIQELITFYKADLEQKTVFLAALVNDLTDRTDKIRGNWDTLNKRALEALNFRVQSEDLKSRCIQQVNDLPVGQLGQQTQLLKTIEEAAAVFNTYFAKQRISILDDLEKTSRTLGSPEKFPILKSSQKEPESKSIRFIDKINRFHIGSGAAAFAALGYGITSGTPWGKVVVSLTGPVWNMATTVASTAVDAGVFVGKALLVGEASMSAAQAAFLLACAGSVAYCAAEKLLGNRG